MRTAGLAVGIGLLVLAACQQPEVGIDERGSRVAAQRGELTVDGQVRSYRVFAPASLGEDARAPLVVALHDAFGSPDSFREATQLDDAASGEQFVVVYPESLEGTWNGGFCCGRARTADRNVADVEFLTRLVDELEDSHGIDPRRVYATGSSNGAIMAYRLACEAPDRVAAVAAVGGAMVMDDCAPSEPVAILAVHGTEDGHVPYDGGPTSGAPDPAPSQPDLVEAWARLNGCGEDPDRETDGLVTVTSWDGCRDDAEVRLVTVNGGGHTWFSDEFGDGPAGAVDATALVTDFFFGHDS